ncbi:HAD-like domain-containing protein [Microdochium bolleyi]|uniref:HAD-like domain-containing protein n=1 Tax=Microdochium bolleyi TaxID=196109 RepID=A0A136IVE7_9PEZI|nr:HAD-like domain-containing protein [Microdochium bolleyi]
MTTITTTPITVPQTILAEALLFDLDGTLVDSTEAVTKHWTAFGREIGADPSTILQTAHGRRTIDTLAVFCPERANWDYVREMEESIPRDHGEGAKILPGAQQLLIQTIAAGVPWAIVTSGSSPLARGWLGRMDLPVPETMVTAESVACGKPDPAGYTLARDMLGLTSRSAQATTTSSAAAAKMSVVFEDSPAGIRAGRAAGCTVVGLVTSHTLDEVRAAEPHFVVRDLDGVRVLDKGNRTEVLLQVDSIVSEPVV